MSKVAFITIATVAVLVLGVSVLFFLGRLPRSSPIPTLPPPLANVEFPTQSVGYPPDWPADLHYPEQFSVVETSSGGLPDGSKGWAAKLRYNGNPESAASLLSSFFIAKGWQIAEHSKLDSGGFLILIEKGNKKNSGIVVVDPDAGNPGYTKVVATVFP